MNFDHSCNNEFCYCYVNLLCYVVVMSSRCSKYEHYDWRRCLAGLSLLFVSQLADFVKFNLVPLLWDCVNVF